MTVPIGAFCDGIGVTRELTEPLSWDDSRRVHHITNPDDVEISCREKFAESVSEKAGFGVSWDTGTEIKPGKVK